MANTQVVDRSPANGVSTTPISMIGTNPNRNSLLVQNNSGVYVAFAPPGITPSVDAAGNGGVGSVVLAPGAGLLYDIVPAVPTNSFTIVAESGSGNNVTVQET